MAYGPCARLVFFAALLTVAACGGGGSSGFDNSGGAGGEGGAGFDGPALSISDAEVREGNASTRELTFTVTLSEPSEEIVRVAYATEDGTALSEGTLAEGGQDYDPTSATLRFEPGETELTVIVNVNGDRLDEADETFNVVLSKPVGAAIADGEADGTITDDDTTPTLSINDLSLTEGNVGSKDGVLTVTLSEPSGQEVTVEYGSVDGTAIDDDDYTGVDGTLTFAPGETSKGLTVGILGDTVPEGDESLIIELSNPVNAELVETHGTLTVLNDDAAGPALAIDDVAVSEGFAGTKLLTFTISLTPASADAVTVDYATIDDTATAGGVAAFGGFDYIATSDSLTFLPGETAKQVSVSIYGDGLNEDNETFLVELFNGIGATVVDPQGEGTISNDDALPGISIANTSVTEGAAGTRMATFSVTLSSASGRSISVQYATSDSTAASGEDYVADTGTVTFAPGQTTAYVGVTVNGDLLNETDETFYVSLAGAVSANVNDDTAVGTISNDDGLPQIVISDALLVEGDAGTQNAVFTLSLSATSGQDVSVAWTTNDDTASAPSDYVAASGTVTFPAGATIRTVNVAVKGDVLDEPNEAFTVDLSNAVNAVIGDVQGIGSIVGDDSTLPALNIGDASVTEGNAGTIMLSLTVTLEFAVAQQVTVNFATSGDTATSGTDFEADAGTVTFLANETSQIIDITVNGDTLHEPDEQFWVTLSGASNAFVADGYGLATITDDDSAPTLSIGDVTLTEGNAGTKNATFTISLSAASGFPIDVAYATNDGTALEGGSASLGEDDYEATSNVVSFAPGQTSKPVTVPVNGDIVPEGNETFVVQLSAPQNASVADGQGQCTITNDDAIPSITIDDVSAVEGDAGTKTFTFTLTLSSPSGNQVSVDYTTANGTAVSPSDYTATSGTVQFAPGQTTATIAVSVVGEKAAEAHNNETFFVDLTNPMGGTIGDAQGLGTIVSDD